MNDSDSDTIKIDHRCFEYPSTVGKLMDALSGYDRNLKIIPNGLWYITFTESIWSDEAILIMEIRQIYNKNVHYNDPEGFL